MRKYFLLTFLLQFSLAMFAQEDYTDYLQKEKKGRGRVVLHQSKAITDLVNGKIRSPFDTRNTPLPVRPVADSTMQNSLEVQGADSLLSNMVPGSVGQRVRANGYRIQLFSGGNSRAAKNEANMVGQRMKRLFPEVTVYTQFISPHWKCRVGDFRTYEEAVELFNRLKETQQFREAVIVKSKVNIYY